MSYQTVVVSSFEEYLAGTDESPEEVRDQIAEREAVLARFPHAVMLQVAYPEMDFANRWAWGRFGSRDGECYDSRAGSKPSEYPMCRISEPHGHNGKWTCRWLIKTDYDYGFCEWYFAEAADRDLFHEFAPTIHWGENYPDHERS